MATRREIALKQKEITAQISTLIRTLALSVLAVTWIFIAGGKDAPAIVVLVPKSYMVVIAILCIAAISLDLIQYIAGHLQLAEAYKRATAAKGKKSAKYPKSHVRGFAFMAKIGCAIAAAIALAVLLLWAVFQPLPETNEQLGHQCKSETVVIRR